MRTATGLTLVAIGAILAFAIRTTPTFLNIQITGWVIMLTGVAGMFMPRRGNGRLRRRTVTWRPRSTVVASGGPRALGIGRVLHQPAAPSAPPAAETRAGQVVPGTAEPVEETVEEFYQD